MKRNIFYAVALCALAACGVSSCQGNKAGSEATESEPLTATLSEADTATVLDKANGCMALLKSGNMDEALAMMYATDTAGVARPLSEEQKNALRKQFAIFPVLDYTLDTFSFDDGQDNVVKYTVKFFELGPDDKPGTPNTIAFAFCPIKQDGEWLLTPKAPK